MRTSEKRIVKLNDFSYDFSSIIASPDCRHIAFIAESGKGQCLVLDNRRSIEYDSIDYLTFSPDSMSVAYCAKRRWWLFKKSIVVVDDTARRREYEYGAIPHTLVFSPDSRRLAYFGTPDYIIEEVRVPVIKEGKVIEKLQFPWLKDEKASDLLTGPSYSPDLSRFWFASYQESGIILREGWRIHIYGSIWGREEKFCEYAAGSPIVSSDGCHIAYVSRSQPYGIRTGPDSLVLDNRELSKHKLIHADSLSFCPKGKRIAYWAEDKGECFVVCDGQQGVLKYKENVGPIIFSQDGAHMAYAARDGNRCCVVVDGIEKWSYEEVIPGSITFCPNGTRVAFVASQLGKHHIVVEGMEGERFSEIAADSVTFSPDGNRVAYWAQQTGEWFCVMGELRGSPSYCIVGKARLRWDSSEQLHYLRLKDGMVFLVEEDLR